MQIKFVHACIGTFAYIIWPGDIASSEHMENKCTFPCDRVGEIEPFLSQTRRSVLNSLRLQIISGKYGTKTQI